MRSVIIGTGCHIPSRVVPNDYFLEHEFWGADQKPIEKSNPEILKQFEAITGIRERRYVPDDLVTSDIAFDAAAKAIAAAAIDPETLDYIIVAHNFGDVRAGVGRSDLVPALAARVKAKLRIANPRTVAYDLVFGCPGWLQGMIQADAMIRAGDIKRALIVGAETLSRVSDPHDRDSLIYADGAGATIIEGRETSDGILAHAVRSDTLEHSGMLSMGQTYNTTVFIEALFLKMQGHKLYKYALNTVAGAIRECLQRARVPLSDVSKILIHQANGKMDEAILAALYRAEGNGQPPAGVMPLTISWLGNSSVATIPTLLDLMERGEMEGHTLKPGEIAVFASVGAGMHINAAVYRVPSA